VALWARPVLVIHQLHTRHHRGVRSVLNRWNTWRNHVGLRLNTCRNIRHRGGVTHPGPPFPKILRKNSAFALRCSIRLSRFLACTSRYDDVCAKERSLMRSASSAALTLCAATALRAAADCAASAALARSVSVSAFSFRMAL